MLLKNTDLIVTRAGASTLSEIIALKVPSILIPSPYVPNNHQYKNAMDLVSKNAALIIEEKDLNGEVLVNKIDELLNNEEKYQKMKQHRPFYPDSDEYKAHQDKMEQIKLKLKELIGREV